MILLQGVCDYNQQVLDVYVRALGECHDSTHLRQLSLWQKMKNDELPSKNKFKVGGANGIKVQPYLLEDFVYSLCVGLLKCYIVRGTSGPEQNKFDSKWRVGQVKIKNAFGILKNRFQILKSMNASLKYVPTIIVACCILHNFCIASRNKEAENKMNDLLNDREKEIDSPNLTVTVSDIQSKNLVKTQR